MTAFGTKRLRRALGARLLMAGFAAARIEAQASATARPPYDLVISGGTVVDGSGAPRVRADVAIRGDQIARVDADIPHDSAARIIEAHGLVVAPGFIDNHAHVATALVDNPLAENFLRQGITTILASLHAQDQPWPLAEYSAALRVAPNIGFFAGHSWIRKRVLGLENRAPTAAELSHMEALVDSSMAQGALGLATGLEYVPANFASTEELIALARVASRRGGIYVTHMRDEGPGVLTSIDETIRIAREAAIPVQINHHKVAGAAQFGWSRRTLAKIDSARTAGMDVSLDVYPYTAFSTISDVLLPAWALAGGDSAFAARIANRGTRDRIETEMQRIFPEQAGAGLASVQFREVPSHPEYSGRTLADFVRARGQAPTIASGVRAVLELQLHGGFTAIYHSMDEPDVERILRHASTMINSDGDLVGLGVGWPHPRSYGAFPRVLARYVRERRVLTLEEAIRKMTSMPARQIGQRQRGLVRAGMFADLVVFDLERIRDVATYTDPHHFAVGVV